jgi:hypothetical protein
MGVVRLQTGARTKSVSAVLEPKEVHVRTHLTRLGAVLVLLLVSSGLLFAIGSTIERHRHHSEHPAAATPAESGESGSESGSGESTHVEKSHGESGVKILGVDTESLTLTLVAVVASLVLAAVIWLGRWSRPALLAVAAFGLIFAVGDGRELLHQLDESNTDLASIAASLIGLHLAVTAIAATLLARGTSSGIAVAQTHT